MTSERARHGASAGRGRRRLRAALPFAVSGVLLAYLFHRIDPGAALDHFTVGVVGRFVGPLLLWNGVTLAIEARCLTRVARASGARLEPLTAARIKAACYLLSVLHYGLGAAGLSVLLSRRARIGLADAAGMVFLVSLFDVGSVLALGATGAAFARVDSLGLRAGVILALIAAIVAGFLFLRAPGSLGPLDRLRRLDVFRAPRTAPARLLVELAVLRGAFVLTYVAVVGALFQAFAIDVEPGRLGLGVAVLLVVSALPIAAGGLGTGQIAFVEVFSGLAPDAELLAASLLLSIGFASSRAILGLLFAPEFTREALEAAPETSEPRRTGPETSG